jgi:hypothetical protein
VAREFLDHKEIRGGKGSRGRVICAATAKLSDEAFKMWRTAIRQNRIPSELGMPHPPV